MLGLLSSFIADRDTAYVAGSPSKMPSVAEALRGAGIVADHVVIDSFGLQ